MPAPKRKQIEVKQAGFQLVENVEEQQELEAARLRCIAYQDWSVDRAFLVGFQRGSEIAWTDPDQFATQQAEYLRKLQKKRAGAVGRVGERKNASYGRGAAWAAVKWSIVGVLLFGGFYYALRNNFFLGEPEVQVWLSADELAQQKLNEAGPGAVEVYPPELFEAAAPVYLPPPDPLFRTRVDRARYAAYFALALIVWSVWRLVRRRGAPAGPVGPIKVVLEMPE